MAEYIERTEELILSLRAGSRAISNTKKYHGTIYMSDVFSDDPKEIPYLKASEILYAASEEKSADVAPVRHGLWEKAQDMRRMDGNIYDYRCSLCDSLAEKGVYNNYDRLTKYCPNCGARMDVEVPENETL